MILERIRQATNKRRGDAMSELIGIAKREAGGKAKSADAERAVALLETLGMTADRFAELVNAVREIATLTTEAHDADAKQREYVEASRERTAYGEETAAIAQQRREHFHGPLYQKVARAEAVMKRAARARARLNEMRETNPELF